MRITQIHDNVLALLCGTIADTLDDEGLGVTVGYAFDHICNQCSGQTVQGTVFLVISRTSYDHFAVFYCDAQFLGELSGQCALCTLYGNQIFVALYFNAGRTLIGFFPILDIILCPPYQTNAKLRRRRSAHEPSCLS